MHGEDGRRICLLRLHISIHGLLGELGGNDQLLPEATHMEHRKIGQMEICRALHHEAVDCRRSLDALPAILRASQLQDVNIPSAYRPDNDD